METKTSNTNSATDEAQNANASIDPNPHDIAIIIVTYNSEEQIRACLKSIYSEILNTTQKVVVIDNNSTDGTVDIIKKDFPEVKLILPKANLGFAKAVNQAAQQIASDYILLLNPDTIVLNNAIDKAYTFAEENPQYGFYGCQTLKEDGESLERSSCWGAPTVWSAVTFGLGLNIIFRHNKFFDPESLGNWQRDSVREVGVITGCFLLIKRTVWNALEGFDEHFWLYGEDVDLAMRARKAGHKLVIYPDAKVIHEVGQSSTSAQKIIWLFRGKCSVANRHFTGFPRFAMLASLKLGVFLRASANRLKGNKNNKWVVAWERKSEWVNGHPSSSNSQN